MGLFENISDGKRGLLSRANSHDMTKLAEAKHGKSHRLPIIIIMPNGPCFADAMLIKLNKTNNVP